MMVSTEGSVFGLVRWQQQNVVFFAGAAAVAWLGYLIGGWDHNPLPQMPVAVVGGAIGIFASFRTNSAYERWWEGRKLWGRMINSSRHWATQATNYVEGKDAASWNAILVRRHIAYVHTLRCLLRKQDPLADRDVLEFLTAEEATALRRESNQTHALLQWQMRDLTALNKKGQIDHFRLASMDRTILDLLNIQGGCERIKGTPLPRGYGFILENLISAYSILLPWAMVHDLGILSIPLNVLVCLSFGLISEAGRVLEDPFNMFWNALPLMNLSKKIENNTRNTLGEYDLAPVPGVDHQGILW